MIVQVAPPEHYRWLLSHTGAATTLGLRALEALDSSGRIRAMAGFDLWTPNSCHAHLAVEEPMALRALLKAAARCVFEACGRKVLLGSIVSDNARSLALAQHLGFREVARVRDGFGDGLDLVTVEMRREDCRWLSQQKKAA